MGNPNPYRKRAVFLDRDGVINRNVWNPESGQYEAPLTAQDFQLLPGVLHALAHLQAQDFLLFVVSNQPNVAKAKSHIEDPVAIHRKLLALVAEAGILFAGCYYCFHHPDGRDEDYTGSCLCRKPSPYMLLQAQTCFQLDLSQSWMIGDRGSDIRCGKTAGVKAILIHAAGPDPAAHPLASAQPGTFPTRADALAVDLPAAVQLILADSGAWHQQQSR